MRSQCERHDYRLAPEAEQALLAYFERIPKDGTFGNGRTAVGCSSGWPTGRRPG
nr:hypothetical protein [Pseudonocardia sp. ICBG601]